MTWFLTFLASTIFRTWPIYAATCGAMLVAEMVYILFGFGAGLIAVGSMAMLLEQVTDVVVMLMLLSIPPELFVAYTNRCAITWRNVGLICAGRRVRYRQLLDPLHARCQSLPRQLGVDLVAERVTHLDE